jgi:hypothetical protein
MTQTTATMHEPMHELTINLPIKSAEALAKTHEDGLEGAAVAALRLWLKIGERHISVAQGYALANGMSVEKAIRKAITALDEKSRRTPDKSLRNIAAERDAEIYRRAKHGIKRKILAAEYDLSLIRIHQIVSAGKKADPDNTPEAKARNAELRKSWEEEL